MVWEIPNEDEARNVELNRYLDSLEEQPPEPDPDWSNEMYEREQSR